MENITQDQIIINLSSTKYDIIEIAAEQLGWTVQYSKKSQSWDVKWVDMYIEAQQLFKLNDHQKISHFPGIDIFAKKNLLGRNLMKVSKFYPQDYNFFPLTWSIPSQYGDLKRYHEKQLLEKQKQKLTQKLIQYQKQKQKQNSPLKKYNQKQIFIFKPSASCQGKGIKLTQNIQDLQNKNGIVQLYVNNPLLIENLKFDLRLYVLIYGHQPLRIYLYEEGLARFATETYVKADKNNMKQNYVHLTNYAINKNNKKFIFNSSQHNMDKGHKRSLTFVYNYLQKKGVDVAQLKSKIQALIVKTLIIGQPMLAHIYHLSQPDNVNNDLTFHILGFDILLKQDYQPVLLEINHTPSFSVDTPLDRKIKKSLIKDTFKILNVNLQTKKQKICKKIQFLQKRFQRKNVAVKLTNEEKNKMKEKMLLQKQQFEKNNINGYKRIYPPVINEKSNKQDDIRTSNNITTQNNAQYYLKFQLLAKRLFQDQNRMNVNNNRSVLSKNSIISDTQSPKKTQRKLNNKTSTINNTMKKNNSYHIKQKRQKILNSLQNPNIHSPNRNTNKINYKSTISQKSQTVPIRSKLPSLSFGGGIKQKQRQRNMISLSAHFPNKGIQKIEFNVDDIFKQIQKKRIDSNNDQKVYQKKNKIYFIQQVTENIVNTLMPKGKFDFLVPNYTYEQIYLPQQRNMMKLEQKQKQKQKGYLQNNGYNNNINNKSELVNEQNLTKLRAKRQQTERLKSMLLKKKI